MQIVPTDPTWLQRLLGVVFDVPVIAFVGVENGEFIGSCGLAWKEGRCWLWFQTSAAKPRHAVKIVRYTATLLAKAAQMGERAVFTVQDKRFGTSGRLMKIAGFTPHGNEGGQDVFRRDIGRAADVGV